MSRDLLAGSLRCSMMRLPGSASGGMLGRPATAAEVQVLTETEARAIYRQQYITGSGFEAIRHPALLHLLVDAAVHSGPKRSVQWLQTALGVTADSVIGPKTRAALAAADQGVLYGKVLG